MMHHPPHPGEFIREVCLKPLGLNLAQAASYLGVTCKTLSALINGRSGISAEMAWRLSLVFNITPESWLIQQMQYDLWHAKQCQHTLKIRSLQKRKPNELSAAM